VPARTRLQCCLVSGAALVLCPAFACAADIAFDFATPPAAGLSPKAVAVGKLDAGTSEDVVVSNTSDNTVSVLLGNGDGTFATQQPYATGSYPYAVILDDFNNDGVLDIVAVNRGDFPGTVSLLLGNGNGTFKSQKQFAVGYSPRSATSGDFGDGHIGLAVTNGTDTNITILLNDGLGNLTPQATTYATGGDHPEGIAAVRLVTAGNLDLVVAAGSVVSVLRGNGNGTFQTAVPYTTVVGSTPTALAIADFNGDTHPDVVVANGIANSISVFLGKGDGTLLQRADYNTNAGTFALAVGDFDHDGNMDVAAISGGTPNLVLVFLGKGDGTLQAGRSAASLPNFAGFMATGHFRNAESDLAVADTSGVAQILLNRSEIFHDPFEVPGECPPGTILLGNGTCGVP